MFFFGADLEDVFTGCVAFAVDSAYAFCLSSVVLVLIHVFWWDVMLRMYGAVRGTRVASSVELTVFAVPALISTQVVSTRFGRNARKPFLRILLLGRPVLHTTSRRFSGVSAINCPVTSCETQVSL